MKSTKKKAKAELYEIKLVDGIIDIVTTKLTSSNEKGFTTNKIRGIVPKCSIYYGSFVGLFFVEREDGYKYSPEEQDFIKEYIKKKIIASIPCKDKEEPSNGAFESTLVLHQFLKEKNPQKIMIVTYDDMLSFMEDTLVLWINEKFGDINKTLKGKDLLLKPYECTPDNIVAISPKNGKYYTNEELVDLLGNDYQVNEDAYIAFANKRVSDAPNVLAMILTTYRDFKLLSGGSVIFGINNDFLKGDNEENKKHKTEKEEIRDKNFLLLIHPNGNYRFLRKKEEDYNWFCVLDREFCYEHYKYHYSMGISFFTADDYSSLSYNSYASEFVTSTIEDFELYAKAKNVMNDDIDVNNLKGSVVVDVNNVCIHPLVKNLFKDDLLKWNERFYEYFDLLVLCTGEIKYIKPQNKNYSDDEIKSILGGDYDEYSNRGFKFYFTKYNKQRPVINNCMSIYKEILSVGNVIITNNKERKIEKYD